MKTLLKETGQIIRFNLKNLLLFLIGYRLTAAAVYLRLLDAGMRFSLRQAGYGYLTLENAGKVCLSPWTIPAVLALLCAGLFLLMAEAGGLVAAYWAAMYSLRLPGHRIFVQGIQNAIQQIRRRNFGLFAVVLADFLLMNLFYIYRTLTHIKPVDFVIGEMSGRPGVWALVAAVVWGCVAAVIPTYFVFHQCMVEQKFYRDGKRGSVELLKGRWARTVIRVVFPQLLVVLAAWVLYGLLLVMMAVFTVFFVRRDLQFAFLIRASSWTEWIVMGAASMGASLLFFADLTVQYDKYRGSGVVRKHFFYTGEAMISRKNGLAALAAWGLIGGLGLIDAGINGTFLASSVAARTEITAHRGSSSSAPENTMAALEAAVEEMADWAEIDVQETADGVVVLCHDITLERVAGVKSKVRDLTFEEIQKLDGGSWFGKEFAGERIPALAEVMEYAKGRLNLNIELKYSGMDSGLPEKVGQLVAEYEMEDQCVISCANINYLKRIRKLDSQIKTGYIIPAAYGDYYIDENVDVISIRSGFVTESLVRKAHEAGKSVHAWTVNEKMELERMRVLMVDNVITDVPVLAREILYREEATENLLEYLKLIFK